ncbi:uncharacterized protein LOC113850856 [Abrus precatorius]|uniref:Uncharacterized protein LOC113850856 n=1 Tax=Abrus precatorius TaxID=3816 RepID=A0A8B8K081_ABRPR|nr:uncharacterized protein LOC113850856 [Abrus precatorius]
MHDGVQVKQQKKSSNKWSCAVCNEKQSVRKVFAQGFMAKDIRKFVQSFNMSRKSLDDGEWPLAGTLDPAPEHYDDEITQKKKRNDWSAYLDQEDHHTVKEQERDHGNDFEPLVVTELPKGVLKKRRLEENSTAGNAKLFKKPLFRNSQEEPMIDQQRITSMTESNAEKNNYVTPDNQRTEKCKTTISRGASKWNEYLNEDNDSLELAWKRGFKDHSGPCNNSILEAITSEQRVEDDIHPDFM